MQNDFSTGKVWKQVLAQAIPLTLAEIVQLLYNIIDRIYLGHLPESESMALTGVGLVFPFVSLIGAFTSLFGSGGLPLFSIARGAKQEERARRIQGNVFSLLIICSIALMLLSHGLKRPILFLFGASETSYPYANAYLSIYLLGTPFTMLATGLNGFINAQGYPKIGMMTTMLGALLNLLLDSFFIFGLGWGVQGAAWATVISQIVSCAWVIAFFLGKRALYPLRRRDLPVQLSLLREIVSLGIVGFVMKATNSLVQAACNSTLQTYGGDLYVGVMTVVNSVREVLSLPVSGLTSGTQPILGYNYGAERPERVKEGIRFSTLAGVAYTTAMWLCVLGFPRAFVSIFSSDSALLEAGSAALKIYFFGFFFQAFQICGQMVFQALGDAKHAVFFSVLRKVVIVLPLTLLLPRFGLGVQGVFFAEPISNALGGLACYITMLLTIYRKLSDKHQTRSAAHST